MKRIELVKIIDKHLTSDWKILNITDKDELSPIYIGRYSKLLNRYVSDIKCFNYKSINNTDKIIWYFYVYINNGKKEFLVPNESVGDFVEIFINRYSLYLDIKKELDSAYNDIFILCDQKSLKEEIREYKIKKVIKSENQE
jgi:hypothetical protein